MATPPNNLNPQAQPWARDMEKRMAALERSAQASMRTQVNVDNTLQSTQVAMRAAASPLVTLQTFRRSGAGSSSYVSNELMIPDWATSVTAYVMGQVTPNVDGGGGTSINGSGTLFLEAYYNWPVGAGLWLGFEQRNIPVVGSTPGSFSDSSEISAAASIPRTDPYTKVRARLDATFSGGVIDPGGTGFIYLQLIFS